MMKKLIPTILILAFTHRVIGQNLIPNPSFEELVYCPKYTSEVYNALYWDNCGGGTTADFFYDCPDAVTVGVPANFVGYQNAATGKAYCGFYCYDAPGGGYREYITAQLLSPLITGQKYYVSFKVSRADDTTFFMAATNKIGARFSMSPCGADPVLPDNLAHVYSNTIITDMENWTLISGSFIADMPYAYIRLGNFFDNFNTDKIGTFYSYYYIDDICVTRDSLSCFGGDSTNSTYNITPPEFPIPNVFSPNGDGINDLFVLNVPFEKDFLLKIYNRWGKLIFSTNDATDYWDGKIMQTNKDAPDGTYYYILESIQDSDRLKKGFIILLRN